MLFCMFNAKLRQFRMLFVQHKKGVTGKSGIDTLLSLYNFKFFSFCNATKLIFKTKTGLPIQVNPRVSKKGRGDLHLSIFKRYTNANAMRAKTFFFHAQMIMFQLKFCFSFKMGISRTDVSLFTSWPRRNFSGINSKYSLAKTKDKTELAKYKFYVWLSS